MSNFAAVYNDHLLYSVSANCLVNGLLSCFLDIKTIKSKKENEQRMSARRNS